MDLLDRINALTDDQLRLIADRDDATGVLASYRLAELRGVPAPERSVVVMADDYAIVAQDGKIERINIEGIVKVIREEGDQYCVYSEDGSRSFGCYDTRAEAEERLRQIHYFEQDKQLIREGSFVSWNSSGGRARGQVEHIMTEGVLGIPDSEFQINAEPDDPAVLIRIWREYADGWRGTETLVGHKMSTLTSIEPLNKQATKREDGEDFPAAAFAYVPDPESPSTWKLRLWDSLEERETRQQVGRAIAALGPGGFRGNQVDIPAEDLPGVKRRILDAWRDVWGDEAGEVPDVLKESFSPPQGVQDAAQRALDWIAEGHAGSGFTDVGRARAAQLARGESVSRETIGRMASFFARHSVNEGKTGWNLGEDGFPSPARVAWDAWGGDPGRTWAESIMGREDKQTCPIATSDPDVNAANRDIAAREAMYGPADLDNPGSYWQDIADAWELPLEVARERKCGNCAAFDQTPSMLACIRDGGNQTEGVGYCRIWDFLCAAERTCTSWGAGGPIKSVGKERRFVRKADEKRFTLGPLYVPDFMDAHGEWTDAEELQNGVWHWVRLGDRRIFLQHDTEVEAGEWVEVMTMPQAWTVDMIDADGETIGQVTYPPNTVFLGVVWNEEAWELVKAGQLRGYSIGGFSDRMYADLPMDGEREGIEMDKATDVNTSTELDLVGSIAEAVAAAIAKTQPTVNVVMPDTRMKARRIERDEHGNIARIIEEED